jgi:hypothetical protein
MPSIIANRTLLEINPNSRSGYKNGQIYQDEKNRIQQSQIAQKSAEKDLDKNAENKIIDNQVEKTPPKSKLNEMTDGQKLQALNRDKISPTSIQSAEKEEVSGNKNLETDKKGLSEEQRKQAEAAIGKKYQMRNKDKGIEDKEKESKKQDDEKSPEEKEAEKRKKKIDQEGAILKNNEKTINKGIKDNLSNEARKIDDTESQKSDDEKKKGNKFDTAFNVHNDAEYEKLALEHLMKLKKVRLKNDPSQDEPIHIDDKLMDDFFKDQELKTAQITDDVKNAKQKERQELSLSAIDYIANNIGEDSKNLKYDDLNGLNEAAKEVIKENLEKFTEALESVKNPIDGLSEARRKEMNDHIKSKISFIQNCNQGDSLVRLGKILKEEALFGEYEEKMAKEIDGSNATSLPSNLKGDEKVNQQKTFADKFAEKKKNTKNIEIAR